MTSLDSDTKNLPQTFYLEFLGCRLNAAEIEGLARQFAASGGVVVKDPAQADIIVLNTCAVTEQAAHKSQHRLKKLNHQYPSAKIAVIGCWATDTINRAVDLPGVAWVLPNSDKARVVDVITGNSAAPAHWAPGRWGHTRGFIPVQDGCDHYCTYCLTQVLRGPNSSRPLGDVIDAVVEFVAQGAQEIILTGVSLGAYGRDRGGNTGLSHLVARILQDTSVPRLRLSSIEPWDVDESLLRLLQNPRLCRQLHMPLQSGSDTILKRMGRRITSDQFADIVQTARNYSPEIAITTDVMVGFPGETEEEYEETRSFIQHLKFAKLHVFPYSERAGTAAVHLDDQVPKKIRKSRANELRELSKKLACVYREQHVGRTLPVLYEKCEGNQRWSGWADTYVRVAANNPGMLYNRIIDTTITENTATHLVGRIS